MSAFPLTTQVDTGIILSFFQHLKNMKNKDRMTLVSTCVAKGKVSYNHIIKKNENNLKVSYNHKIKKNENNLNINVIKKFKKLK